MEPLIDFNKVVRLKLLYWYQYFIPCVDKLNLCSSNIDGLNAISGSVKNALANGSVAFFSINTDTQTQKI
jgi:hypothetical protein